MNSVRIPSEVNSGGNPSNTPYQCKYQKTKSAILHFSVYLFFSDPLITLLLLLIFDDLGL